MDEEGFAQRERRRAVTGSATRSGTSGADVVLVMSADHVYRFDYRDVVETHREEDAECTVVATEARRRSATTPRPRRGRGGGRPGRVDRLRLQAGRPGDRHGRGRGHRSTGARRAASRCWRSCTASVRRARERRRGRHGAGRLRRPFSCRGSSSAAAPARTGSTATGATSASPTTTCAPTASCSTDDVDMLRCRLADPDPPAAAGARAGPRRRELVDSLLSAGLSVVAGRRTPSVLGPGVAVEAGRRGARQRGPRRHRGPLRRPGALGRGRRRLRGGARRAAGRSRRAGPGGPGRRHAGRQGLPRGRHAPGREQVRTRVHRLTGAKEV